MKIVAIADRHGHLDFEIPACDLLIDAGDICPDRFGKHWARGSEQRIGQQHSWMLAYQLPWWERQPARFKHWTWGNHDYVAQAFPPVQAYAVVDGMRFYPATAADDPDPGDVYGGGVIKVWYSPWSNEFCGWNWMKEPADLKAHYDLIPAGTDVIVSHTPPYGYGDTIPEHYLLSTDKGDRHKGSHELLAAIMRVKPRVVICGHIHGGYGHYRMHIDDGTGLDPHEHDVDIYNVSVVNDAYERVNAPTVIEL